MLIMLKEVSVHWHLDLLLFIKFKSMFPIPYGLLYHIFRPEMSQIEKEHPWVLSYMSVSGVAVSGDVS